MMSELSALLRACKDEPEDDAPRLVLADWLQERGQLERAEYIRNQIGSSDYGIDDEPPDPSWLGAWGRWGRGSWWSSGL